jgi:hypothetical protein
LTYYQQGEEKYNPYCCFSLYKIFKAKYIQQQNLEDKNLAYFYLSKAVLFNNLDLAVQRSWL